MIRDTVAISSQSRAAAEGPVPLVSPFIDWQLGPTEVSILRVLCRAVVALVPLIEAFRGVDMTDTGFVLTNQQLIFSDPASVSYWFHLWLTNVIGGLVYVVFGAFGLLPFKIAAAVIFWGMVWIALRLFESSIHRDVLWLGAALATSFSFADKINIVHYDNLSALFFGGGIVLLTAGITRRKPILIFLGGLTLTLNVFVRLPNAAGVTFILVAPILNLFERKSENRLPFGWMTLVWFGIGCAAAVAGAFALMERLGHVDIYLASLKDLFVSAGQSASSYSAERVIMRPFLALPEVLRNGAIFLAFLAGAALLSARFGRRPGLEAALAAAVGSLLTPVGDFVARGDEGAGVFATVAGMGYLLVAAMLLVRPPFMTGRFKLAATYSVLATFALSVGSDTQILPSAYAFPLLMPAVLFLLLEWARVPAHRETWTSRRSFRDAVLYCVVVLSVVGRWTLARQVYRDTPQLAATADVAMIRGVFTSPARARALEDTVHELGRFVHPGDRVLIWDSLGMLHFITHTKPYLDNPWPVLYTDVELEAKLLEKEHLGSLPYVIIARRNPRSAMWPVNSEAPVKLDPIMRFVQGHGMREVWSNDVVTVYSPI